jgi:spore coat protein U-like protein
MRRVEPVWHAPPGRRWARLAGNAGAALWLGLAPICTLASTTCGVSTPGLAFGAYDVFAASVTNGNATLSVTCSLVLPSVVAAVNYTVSLSPGSSGSFVQRQMKSGANSLGYNLYTSNAYSIVWGDGTGTSQSVSGTMRLNIFTNPSQTDKLTVYGQIPALQDAAVANNYTDNVTITMTF